MAVKINKHAYWAVVVPNAGGHAIPCVDDQALIYTDKNAAMDAWVSHNITSGAETGWIVPIDLMLNTETAETGWIVPIDLMLNTETADHTGPIEPRKDEESAQAD